MTIFSELALPKVIFETQTPYNGKVEIWESGKTRRLIVEHYLQSTNWESPIAANMFLGRTVDVLVQNEPNARNILVLGLGGGTMQHLLSHKLPGCSIVSVDIDPAMVEIARKFFDLDKIPNHKIINNDACRVIVEPDHFGLTENMFDAAIVDIFVGDKFPELGKSGNFIAGLKRLIRPGGLLVFNRIYHGDHQDEVNMFIEMLHDFLVDVQSLIIAGKTNSDNVIIYGRVL